MPISGMVKAGNSDLPQIGGRLSKQLSPILQIPPGNYTPVLKSTGTDEVGGLG